MALIGVRGGEFVAFNAEDSRAKAPCRALDLELCLSVSRAPEQSPRW